MIAESVRLQLLQGLLAEAIAAFELSAMSFMSLVIALPSASPELGAPANAGSCNVHVPQELEA